MLPWTDQSFVMQICHSYQDYGQNYEIIASQLAINIVLLLLER